ncbi:hypothetical protein [Litoreibacter arenae]|uniref:Uncharacterized protein n=1 Tax=Litoreibacter arenae DSM 19593 TaxID=1123360 RepID=S9RSW9_9RHOB|nr:hypothetical protein [Litoreibacter arenae]EPX81140.1 hypothetical protein thalar_00589 [Litoreibacter arenae DSM 19593]
MAVVKEIKKDDSKDYPVSRTTSRCTYTVVHSGEEPYLDLRTYGSETRMVEGHASQVMQFDRNAARTLYRALRETFDFD